MTVSFAEATAAARRIKAGDYPGVPEAAHRIAKQQDADLLAGFVLAGDTERLRAALAAIVDFEIGPDRGPVDAFTEVLQIARAALAEGGV